MAAEAGRADVRIAGPPVVFAVHRGLIVFVTHQTGELTEVARHLVAGGATAPGAAVAPAVDREERSIVCEHGAGPPGRVVAGGAIGGEAGALVSRIGGRIVVREVAAHALGALADVDPIVVTLLAGRRLVRPRERELSP